MQPAEQGGRVVATLQIQSNWMLLNSFFSDTPKSFQLRAQFSPVDCKAVMFISTFPGPSKKNIDQTDLETHGLCRKLGFSA
jgi:hypothetical protein